MNVTKFGFIGCGNMGGSLARAVVKAVGGERVILADKSAVKSELFADELHCKSTTVKELALEANIIFLGVKPQAVNSALEEVSATLKNRTDRFILISMVAGLKISKIKEIIGFDCPVIRIMPNIPVSAGEGMILYSPDNNVFMDEIGQFTDAMRFAGKLDRIDETMINAATAVSGCGPAFVYLFAEAMADAGVECGLQRSSALEYTIQTLIGAAELLRSTNKHPAVLKDEVCSPAGSTIEGVHTLENYGFRGAVMNAVKAAFDKTNKV